jgi:hypothetical protein
VEEAVLMQISYVIEIKKADIGPEQLELVNEACKDCHRLYLSNSYVFLHNDESTLDRVIGNLKARNIKFACRPMTVSNTSSKRGLLEV